MLVLQSHCKRADTHPLHSEESINNNYNIDKMLKYKIA